MKLIFIYGAPAAGKLTVANELAAITAFKVFHNHLSIDAVEPIFAFGTKPFWKLVNKFRLDVLAEAARENVNLIYTFCYAKDLDDSHVAQILEAIEANGGEVAFVLLQCDQAELERRVIAKSRKQFGKVSDVKVLREILGKYNLFSPVPQRESLMIDNTKASAKIVAKQIAEHYQLFQN